MLDDKIPDDDNLYRHCVFPVAFRGNNKKRFAYDKLILLVDKSDGSVVASLAWGRYLPTAVCVHAYGCRLAARRNDAKRKEGTYKDKNRHIYCGAYQITARAIRALNNDVEGVESADAIHRMECGEIAHADFIIWLRNGYGIEGTKTAILDRFWNNCRGPLKHVCPDDVALEEHPSGAMDIPPAGEV
jgi:hypothetical protein